MAFRIPNVWYAIYPSYGITHVTISPYLCTGFLNNEIMARIFVNGDAQEVSLPINVTQLIKQLLVENPEMVSVQVNEEFAEREDWENTDIKEGDKVDFLYFMGGGSAAFSLNDK